MVRRERLRNNDIRIELEVEPIFILIERNQLRRYDHAVHMDENRTPVKYYKWTPAGKRPIGRPRKRWKDLHNTQSWERSTGDTGVRGRDGTVRRHTRMEGIHEAP